jgi:DnaK suppressor protein
MSVKGRCGKAATSCSHLEAACDRRAAAIDVAAKRQYLKGLFFAHHDDATGGITEMEGTGLKKKDLRRFRDTLLAKKKEILRNAQRTLNEDMTLDADDLPDEMDLASSEYLHSFTFRLRGREKVFLEKIDHALEKIKDGSFGICEQCGEPISIKRLEARLETTLCIRS